MQVEPIAAARAGGGVAFIATFIPLADRHRPSVTYSRSHTPGHHPRFPRPPDVPTWLMATEESRRSSPQLLASRIDRLPRIWRLLAGGIAGGFAGGLVAGLGARGAMRLIGMAAGEEAQGTAPTGEIVGRFTWLGTLGILEFAVIVGIGAGLYYVWIRRFLPFSGLMKGLAFGGILLTTLAIELMLSDEFAFFRPPILGVSLFALLPLVFGVVAVPVADHFVAAIPPRDDHPRRTQIGKWTIVGASVLGSLLASFNLIGALVDSV